jgi:hypothetical protein
MLAHVEHVNARTRYLHGQATYTHTHTHTHTHRHLIVNTGSRVARKCMHRLVALWTAGLWQQRPPECLLPSILAKGSQRGPALMCQVCFGLWMVCLDVSGVLWAVDGVP